MTKQLSIASRAGSLLLALTMLSLAIFKAQACQSPPMQPEPHPEPQVESPAGPAQNNVNNSNQLNGVNKVEPAVDMAKPAEDMAKDEDVEPQFLPATKSGSFMFKRSKQDHAK